jgi:hypothetical protein
MAEKRVSVRLAAIGGKQVRAELEGVGDAGTRGFGRMSREAELANARLSAFATRVKIAAGVAMAAAVAAGVAMVKSGLETIDTQANLAQSLGTTTRSIQVLAFAGNLAGVSMEEIATASKKLTLKLSDAAGGTGTRVEALRRLHLTATDLQALPLETDARSRTRWRSSCHLRDARRWPRRSSATRPRWRSAGLILPPCARPPRTSPTSAWRCRIRMPIRSGRRAMPWIGSA